MKGVYAVVMDIDGADDDETYFIGTVYTEVIIGTERVKNKDLAIMLANAK